MWRIVLSCLNTSLAMSLRSLHKNLHASSRRIPLWVRDRTRFAAVSALLSATVYALLAGFTLPTQRALLSLLVVYALFLSARRIAFRHVLSAILLLALLFDPLASLSASVWLSFGAVAALLWIGSGRITTDRQMLAWPASLGARIAEGVRLQVCLSLILVPVTIAWFDQASLVSPVAGTGYCIPGKAAAISLDNGICALCANIFARAKHRSARIRIASCLMRDQTCGRAITLVGHSSLSAYVDALYGRKA